MHELLLHAPVPASRHYQVLSILAGLAAMQPVPLCEHVQLYKPNRLPEALKAVQVGAVQGVNVPKNQVAQMQAAIAGDLFYLRLVRVLENGFEIGEKGSGTTVTRRVISDTNENADSMDVDSEHSPKAPKPADTDSKPSTLKSTSQPLVILQFRDLPEPTRHKDRAVTSRLIADIPISSGSPTSFMAALDYSPTSFYYTEGHRLSHNNIAIHLSRVLVPSASMTPGLDPLDVTKADLRLLDESGGYILQASVRVQDGSKVETMQRGANELLGLRETLRGVVELEVVERLSLDTRVR